LGAFNNGAFVNIPSAAEGAFDSIVANDAFTISLWIFGNAQQPVNQWSFHAEGPTSDRVIGSHAPWGDGVVYYDVAGCCGPTQRISAAAPSPDDFMGRWNHYAYLKDGPSTAVYINGELLVDSGANFMEQLPEITAFHIGGFRNGASSHGGMFDDFALFDVALSESQIASIVGGTPIPRGIVQGDFNNDGVIDEADFQILAMNMGAHNVRAVGHDDGDFDLNGRVDLHDFRGFKDAFPAAFGGAAGVPEPTTITLALLAIGMLLPLGRRRSKRS
jgi:hypothetical protein